MRFLFLLLVLLAGGAADAADPGVLGLLPSDSVTTHTITLGATPVPYTATAGTLPLFDQSGSRLASVFYTAYAREGAGRPLTFVFNGGPGAASAYLHLGLVGPRIVQFGADGHDGAGAVLRDNPQSWLEFTDLVIIDPIGTGWSRTAKSDDAAHFWGVREDANVLAKIVALYVTHAGRAASPKYLLGESYGGMRIVKIADALQSEQGIVVSGLIMVSPLLDGALTFGGDRLALGAALKLPSVAASVLVRRHQFTPAALADAEHFALGEYLTTLAGTPPSGAAADAFYRHVAAMTDVPADVVARGQGFLGRAVLRPQGSAVSAYDATFDVGDGLPDRHGDPLLYGFTRAYGGAFVGYAHDELGFHTYMTYELLNSEVAHRWNWHSDGSSQQMPEVADDLRELLALNHGLRLLVASGYSDLVTPYMAARYVLDHIAVPAQVTAKVYPGGHMIYLNDQSRLALTGDVRSFYAEAPRE